MSWYKCVGLRCDGCGEIVDTAESTVADARRSEEWVRRQGKDLCFGCREITDHGYSLPFASVPERGSPTDWRLRLPSP